MSLEAAFNRVINWPDHINNPHLEALLAQFGDEYLWSANEIDDLRDAFKYLVNNTSLAPTITVIHYQGTLPDNQPIGSKVIESLNGNINGVHWKVYEMTSLGWIVIKQPSYTNYNFPRTMRIETFNPNAFVGFVQASGNATQKITNTGFINVSDIVCNEAAAGFQQATKRKRLHAFNISMNTNIEVHVVIFKTNSSGANQTEIFNRVFNGATFQVNLPGLQSANFLDVVIERGDILYAYEKVSGVTSARWSYRYNLEFLNL